jgi:chromosome segregation ATPase
MDQELFKKDPLATGKKTAMTVFVSVVGITSILTFLLFGKLLKDFLIFDANRIEAAKELANLHDQIKDHEKELKVKKNDLEEHLAKAKEQTLRLDETIAKRQSLIASQQKLVDECTVLAEKVSSAKKDYQGVLDDLKTTSEKVSLEKGTAYGLKSENSALIAQKMLLQVDLDTLAKRKDENEKAVKQSSAQVTTFKQEKSTTLTELAEARKMFTDLSTSLTNQNIKVASARRTLAQLEDEIGKMKGTYDSLSAQVTLAKETVKTKLSTKAELDTALADLKQKQADISALIPVLEERKRNAEAQARAAEAKAEQANIKLQDIIKATTATANQPLAVNASLKSGDSK